MPEPSPLSPLARYEKNLTDRITNFNDPHQEWRRLVSEMLGTFFLVLAAPGGGMMGHAFPGYIVAQLAGATIAALVLHAIINVSATYGSNYPAKGYSAGAAFWMELILTTGLVSVILRTAGGAQGDLFTEVYESGRS